MQGIIKYIYSFVFSLIFFERFGSKRRVIEMMKICANTMQNSQKTNSL